MDIGIRSLYNRSLIQRSNAWSPVQVCFSRRSNSELMLFIKVDYVCHGKIWDCPEDPYAVPKHKNIYRVVDSGSDLTTEMIIERIVSHA